MVCLLFVLCLCSRYSSNILCLCSRYSSNILYLCSTYSSNILYLCCRREGRDDRKRSSYFEKPAEKLDVDQQTEKERKHATSQYIKGLSKQYDEVSNIDLLYTIIFYSNLHLTFIIFDLGVEVTTVMSLTETQI